MKKFTKILICLLLCVFSFGIVGCDNRTEEEKNFTYPNAGDLTTGNGGLAVKKGNYVYFVNGYKSVASLNNGNKNDTYTAGALMLMKLDENGNVVTDENGLLKDEYYITMSNQLCGYEATNLFIHNDYLYFVTPSDANESGDKVWAKDRVIFKRIKLNKKGKVETVYSSGVKFSELSYEYYIQDNSNLFILVHEKGNSYYEDYGTDALIRVDADEQKHNIVANDVKNVSFSDNGNEIFYVQKNEEKYKLNSYNIFNNNSNEFKEFSEYVKVMFTANDDVYIVKQHENIDGYLDLRKANFTDKSFENVLSFAGKFDANNEIEDKTIKFATTPSENEVDVYVVAIIDGKLVIVGDNKINVPNGNATDIIGFTNGCIVYYENTDSNTIIKKVSYSNLLAGSKEEPTTIATLELISSDYICFDLGNNDNYVYFYNKAGENYYLNRLKVNNNLEEEVEMFGAYESADAPEIPEEEEEEVEEE